MRVRGAYMGNSRWIGRGKQVEEAEEEEDMTGLRRRWERKAEEQEMKAEGRQMEDGAGGPGVLAWA